MTGMLVMMLMALLSCAWYEGIMVIWLGCVFMMLHCGEFDFDLNFFFMLDGFSYSLVFLTMWLMGLSLISGLDVYTKNNSWVIFFYVLMGLSIGLILTFSVNSYMGLYLGFESCFIPIIFIMMGWGYQPERVSASYFMLMYSVIGSFPLLLVIMFSWGLGMMELGNVYLKMMMMEMDSYILVLFTIGFLVKFPMYGVHIWLPKAHVESPTSGSMLLAGVLLKLGGYGLYRFNSMFNYNMSTTGSLIISLSILGGAVSGVLCMRQSDMKTMVAYSSVVHMSMCICILFLSSGGGMKGLLYSLISHGLCSSGLFMMVGMMFVRLGGRSFILSKGVLLSSSLLSMWWFVLLALNMSIPPSINFLGEILMIMYLLSWEYFLCFFVMFICFFSGTYSVYMYSGSQHGDSSYMVKGYFNLSSVENLSCVLHIFPGFFLFLLSEYMMYV